MVNQFREARPPARALQPRSVTGSAVFLTDFKAPSGTPSGPSAIRRVGIADFPDESATAFLLSLGSMDNVRTTTLRTFNSDKMTAITARSG